MKPTIVADEMFPEGAGFMDLEEAGGSSGLYMDLATNEKHVHSDFFNNFEDLYDDDEDLPPLPGQSNAPQQSSSAQQPEQQYAQQLSPPPSQTQQAPQQQSQQPSQSGSN